MKLCQSGLILFAAVLWITLLAGCGGSGQTGTNTATLASGEPAYATAMTDKILQALSSGDYAAFSRNYDASMKLVMTEAAFNQTRDLINGKIGTYVSKQFSSVQEKDGYTIVVYQAKYTDEPGDVTVSIAFTGTGDKVLFSGIWFDSPKLREQ